MKLSEIYEIANGLAPKALSDEYCKNYGAYDNSGILVDTGDEITGIVFSLDLSLAAIDRAVKENANLIVTHHPAIFGKIGEINAEKNILGEKLVKCIKKGISVVSMHLNLDGAIGGIDESLMQGVIASAGERSGENEEAALMHPLSTGGYGRVYDVPECTAKALAKGMGEEFSTSRILVYGEDKTVNRVASFCGAGADEEAVAFAKANGADAIVSADFKHHVITGALESGLAVIVLTHYASEYYGFKKYYKKIGQSVNVPCILHTDEYLL